MRKKKNYLTDTLDSYTSTKTKTMAACKETVLFFIYMGLKNSQKGNNMYFRVYIYKSGKKAEMTYETHDKSTIYERFSSCMVARYINHAPWIKRVCSNCNYDGTYTYKFYGDNEMIYEFRIER